jgi:hypothetical protein
MKLLAFAVFLALTPVSLATDYYCVLFGQDSKVSRAAESHTFAAFMAVEDGKPLKPFCISWGPAEKFRLNGKKVEGRNRSLEESLKVPMDEGKLVTMFGPYRMPKTYFDAAKKRYEELNSNAFTYKALDGNSRDDDEDPGVNCIHAVSDIGGKFKTVGRYGKKATDTVVKEWLDRDVISTKNVDAEKLIKEMGLDKYGFKATQTKSPRRGLFKKS